MSRFRFGAAALVFATMAPLACSDVTDVELLQIEGSGAVAGAVFLDLDGSGAATPSDTPMVSVNVLLLTPTGDLVQTETSDSAGGFLFEEVPVGSYRLTIDSAALGDSLSVLGAGDPISVGLGQTTQSIVGARYEELTIEEARSAPVGRRIFTSGIALNSRLNFGDGQVHFAGDAASLRGLEVARSSLAPGDSVRLLGRVVVDNGQPALRDVTPYILVQAAELVLPRVVTVAEAASARGGSLDAAFVRIRDAEITDTATTTSDDFRFWAVRGGDSVEVVIREFLALNHEAFRPDTTIRLDRLDGLLSPFQDGGGGLRWRLLPRTGSDIALETKFADVAVSVALDTTDASLGDTVEVRVVAFNSGPLSASDVKVQDTIPTALSHLSSTATGGSYDPGTGIWLVGDLAAGAADTLTVRMEVTEGTPASVSIIAESLGLTFEVDPNGRNNGGVVVLTIS